MADNTTITPGTGKTVLADEVTDGTLGVGIAQFVKVMDGTLDSTNKLVVTAAGAVKSDGSAVTQPVSLASVPSHAVTNAGTFAVQNTAATAAGTNLIGKVGIDQTTPGTTNAVVALSLDTTPATQNITVVDSASSTATGANNQSIITGTPTAGSAATFTLSGQENITVEGSGTWTGTVQSEVSLTGGTGPWYIRGVHQIGSAYTAATFTANFSGLCNVAGLVSYRLRATAAVTGTLVVKVVESTNTASTYIANSLRIADATTPTQSLAVGAAGQLSAQGTGAHGASVTGNPLLSGAEGRTTRATAVTTGQLSRIVGDVFGRLFSIRPALTNTSSAGTAITTNTNTSIITAPSAGNHLRMYRLLGQNSSATGTWIYWTEGSGGTKKYPMYLAQNQVVSLSVAGEWELPTATALYINSATTGANIEWHVSYEIVPD